MHLWVHISQGGRDGFPAAMGTLSLPAMWGGAAAAGGGTSSPPPLSEASPYGSTAFGGMAPSYDPNFGNSNGSAAGNGAAVAPLNDPLAAPQLHMATGPQANRVSLAERAVLV